MEKDSNFQSVFKWHSFNFVRYIHRKFPTDFVSIFCSKLERILSRIMSQKFPTYNFRPICEHFLFQLIANFAGNFRYIYVFDKFYGKLVQKRGVTK